VIRNICMGIFENIQFLILTWFLGIIICSLLTYLTYRYIINRFHILKNERKSFYECGFKPNTQKPIIVSLQFYVICLLFILFDTDLLFLYPFVTTSITSTLVDLILFLFIIFILFISWFLDYKNSGFDWKF